MRKNTKDWYLCEVLNFGIHEEHAFIKAEEDHAAYQIRCAREQMIFALMDSIKEFKTRLVQMTWNGREEDGTWIYNPYHFVADRYTRELVEKFMKENL